MKAKSLTALLLLLVVLTACQQRTSYHHYQPTDPDGWQRTHALRFCLPPAPAAGRYALTVGLRYTPAFPYQGLWIEATTSLSNPAEPVRVDTLYFPISSTTDPTRPLGQGITLIQHEEPLFTLSLRRQQQATVTLRHIMTRELLPNLRDVGLRMERE